VLNEENVEAMVLVIEVVQHSADTVLNGRSVPV
jgi:hypothetical protein